MSLDDVPTICDECVPVADSGGQLLVGECEVCKTVYCHHLFEPKGSKVCVDCRSMQRAQQAQMN